MQHDTFTSCFEALSKRQPSEDELKRLYEMKRILGIRENDALWMILILMESYNTQFARYPDNHIKKLENYLDESTALIDKKIQENIAAHQASLQQSLESLTNNNLDRKTMTAWIQSFGLSAIGMVMLGSICFSAGIMIGTGNIPFWWEVHNHSSLPAIILSSIANTPAGWITVLTIMIILTSNVFNRRFSGMETHFKDKIIISLVTTTLMTISFLCPFAF